MTEHEPHEDSEKDPNRLEMPAALGSVLQLQNTIEALEAQEGQSSFKDVSPTERIAVDYYPDGRTNAPFNEISHIAQSQRVGDSSRYKTYMNYMVLRDGDDESTTRIIKRPPADTPTYEKAVAARAGAEAAEQAGLFKIMDDEVQTLTKLIAKAYGMDEAESE